MHAQEDFDYQASLARFSEIRRNEPEHVYDACRSRLLEHGHRVGRAFLLLHGFTNCPAQWERIADTLYDAGGNVLMPLAPGHGRADRSPRELSHVRAEDVVRWVDGCAGIAAGLADAVTVVGFSYGGVCAAWAGQNIDAVDEVVLVAPAFLPYGYPKSLGHWLPRYTRLGRDHYPWWDPVRRGSANLSPYSYPRLSRRGLGEVFDLGQRILETAPRRTTRLRRAVLVLNERDRAISGPAARAAFNGGIAPLADHVEVLKIEAQLRFPHDFIDPLGANRGREQQARETLLPMIVPTGTLCQGDVVNSDEWSGTTADAGV